MEELLKFKSTVLDSLEIFKRLCKTSDFILTTIQPRLNKESYELYCNVVSSLHQHFMNVARDSYGPFLPYVESCIAKGQYPSATEIQAVQRQIAYFCVPLENFMLGYYPLLKSENSDKFFDICILFLSKIVDKQTYLSNNILQIGQYLKEFVTSATANLVGLCHESTRDSFGSFAHRLGTFAGITNLMPADQVVSGNSLASQQLVNSNNVTSLSHKYPERSFLNSGVLGTSTINSRCGDRSTNCYQSEASLTRTNPQYNGSAKIPLQVPVLGPASESSVRSPYNLLALQGMLSSLPGSSSTPRYETVSKLSTRPSVHKEVHSYAYMNRHPSSYPQPAGMCPAIARPVLTASNANSSYVRPYSSSSVCSSIASGQTTLIQSSAGYPISSSLIRCPNQRMASGYNSVNVDIQSGGINYPTHIMSFQQRLGYCRYYLLETEHTLREFFVKQEALAAIIKDATLHPLSAVTDASMLLTNINKRVNELKMKEMLFHNELKRLTDVQGLAANPNSNSYGSLTLSHHHNNQRGLSQYYRMPLQNNIPEPSLQRPSGKGEIANVGQSLNFITRTSSPTTGVNQKRKPDTPPNFRVTSGRDVSELSEFHHFDNQMGISHVAQSANYESRISMACNISTQETISKKSPSFRTTPINNVIQHSSQCSSDKQVRSTSGTQSLNCIADTLTSAVCGNKTGISCKSKYLSAPSISEGPETSVQCSSNNQMELTYCVQSANSNAAQASVSSNGNKQEGIYAVSMTDSVTMADKVAIEGNQTVQCNTEAIHLKESIEDVDFKSTILTSDVNPIIGEIISNTSLTVDNSSSECLTCVFDIELQEDKKFSTLLENIKKDKWEGNIAEHDSNSTEQNWIRNIVESADMYASNIYHEIIPPVESLCKAEPISDSEYDAESDLVIASVTSIDIETFAKLDFFISSTASQDNVENRRYQLKDKDITFGTEVKPNSIKSCTFHEDLDSHISNNTAIVFENVKLPVCITELPKNGTSSTTNNNNHPAYADSVVFEGCDRKFGVNNKSASGGISNDIVVIDDSDDDAECEAVRLSPTDTDYDSDKFGEQEVLDFYKCDAHSEAEVCDADNETDSIQLSIRVTNILSNKFERKKTQLESYQVSGVGKKRKHRTKRRTKESKRKHCSSAAGLHAIKSIVHNKTQALCLEIENSNSDPVSEPPMPIVNKDVGNVLPDNNLSRSDKQPTISAANSKCTDSEISAVTDSNNLARVPLREAIEVSHKLSKLPHTTKLNEPCKKISKATEEASCAKRSRVLCDVPCQTSAGLCNLQCDASKEHCEEWCERYPKVSIPCETLEDLDNNLCERSIECCDMSEAQTDIPCERVKESHDIQCSTSISCEMSIPCETPKDLNDKSCEMSKESCIVPCNMSDAQTDMLCKRLPESHNVLRAVSNIPCDAQCETSEFSHGTPCGTVSPDSTVKYTTSLGSQNEKNKTAMGSRNISRKKSTVSLSTPFTKISKPRADVICEETSVVQRKQDFLLSSEVMTEPSEVHSEGTFTVLEAKATVETFKSTAETLVKTKVPCKKVSKLLHAKTSKLSSEISHKSSDLHASNVFSNNVTKLPQSQTSREPTQRMPEVSESSSLSSTSSTASTGLRLNTHEISNAENSLGTSSAISYTLLKDSVSRTSRQSNTRAVASEDTHTHSSQINSTRKFTKKVDGLKKTPLHYHSSSASKQFGNKDSIETDDSRNRENKRHTASHDKDDSIQKWEKAVAKRFKGSSISSIVQMAKKISDNWNACKSSSGSLNYKCNGGDINHSSSNVISAPISLNESTSECAPSVEKCSDVNSRAQRPDNSTTERRDHGSKKMRITPELITSATVEDRQHYLFNNSCIPDGDKFIQRNGFRAKDTVPIMADTTVKEHDKKSKIPLLTIKRKLSVTELEYKVPKPFKAGSYKIPKLRKIETNDSECVHHVSPLQKVSLLN